MYFLIFDIFFRHLFALPNTEPFRISYSNCHTSELASFFDVLHCIFFVNLSRMKPSEKKKQSQCNVVKLHLVDPHFKVQTRRKWAWWVYGREKKIGSASSSLRVLSRGTKMLLKTHSVLVFAYFFFILRYVNVFARFHSKQICNAHTYILWQMGKTNHLRQMQFFSYKTNARKILLLCAVKKIDLSLW